ncbi:MAG: hypothetical protein ABJA85_00450 [Bacteroidota bacterium]
MKKTTSLLFIIMLIFAACNNNKADKPRTDSDTSKIVQNKDYIVSKDGIGDLKIGMKQTEVEKLLSKQFNFNAIKDSAGYWQDTVKAKYKEIEVSLYFERQYIDDDNSIMQLSGIETSSTLCQTASGIGVGDEKSTIISAYDDNPIYMGPEFEAVNDTTWLPSKTKYNINVKDDKYDKELIFHLTNKKVSSLQAAIILGD